MAYFLGEIGPQNFAGGLFFDIVDYQLSPAAVTVDVDGVGVGGFAEGDTYSQINLFLLSMFDDTFVGGALDDQANGGSGNDTLTGGGGADTLSGDMGDDVFLVEDGDLVSGDVLTGGMGTDTIRFVAVSGPASASAVFDLSAASYSGIEAIEFETSGTLIVSDNEDAAITTASAAADQTLEIGSWIGGPGLDNIFFDLAGYLSSGFETVTWTEATGDVSAEIVAGQVVVTYENNGPISTFYTTQVLTLELSDGALAKSDILLDNGVNTVVVYDTTDGVGNEKLKTVLDTDLSVGGLAAPYSFQFADYAQGGVADNTLDYSLTLSDAGLMTENAFTAGVLTVTLETDLSLDGLLEPFVTRQTGYYSDGTTQQYQSIVFDATEIYSTVDIQFDANGDEVERVSVSQDGIITETVTTDPSGAKPTEREFTHVAGDHIVTGDGDDETYIVNTGASIYQGQGGNDVFELSGTNTDGTWGALFTFIAQAVTSSTFAPFANQPLAISLNGKVQITDVFEGGMGIDTLQGSDLSEAFLLYDASGNLAINGTLAADTARLNSIEVIEMGDGNDDVNLSSAIGRAEYTIDTLIDGGDGADYLVGGAGNDTIIGGMDGAIDRLAGWKGDDELVGAVGDEDRFLFFADLDNGTDTLVNFTDGEDFIYLFGYEVTNFAAAQVAGLTITDDGTDTTITFGANTTLIVEGVLATAFDSGDFFIF